MLKKLAESGLQKLAKALGYTELTVAEAKSKHPKLPFHTRLIKIPYHDLDGKPTGFFRVRYLEDTRTPMQRKTLMKPTRYAQLPGTVNELYLAPIIKWREVAKDPTVELIITEGEFKAACACSRGHTTIGLGGVWCWRSAKENLAILETFNEFEWGDRNVYIAYDSDAVTNPKVIQAENALADALTKLGAQVFILRIPPGDGGAKQGLDDFLVAGKDLVDITEEAVPYGAAKALHRMNEEVVYVRDPGLILRLDNLQRMTPDAFKNHAYSTRTFTVQVQNGKNIKLETKSTPVEWLRWPYRSEVSRVTYAPGDDRVTTNQELNIWPGWGVEPVHGDVTPWNELLLFLFKNADPEHRKWVERWFAYPLQYPGTKLGTSVVMWGNFHGTGKSALGYTMMKIYGRNATEIADRDLYSNHNEWAEGRQFVMGDEITGGDKRASADRMKSMITQRELRLNPKYVPSYTVPDVINYYFTSNHPDAFFLEDTDRRFFIHEVQGAPKDALFYKKYFNWLNGGGAEALFYHLLHLPIGDWDPMQHAPMTSAKRSMIADAQSDVGAWVRNFLREPEAYTEGKPRYINGCTVATSEDLLMLYDPEGRTKVTANGISRELSRAGASRVNSGLYVKTKFGQLRLWAIDPKLTERPAAEVAKRYEHERANNARKF